MSLLTVPILAVGQSVQSELLTVPAWITLLDFAGFGQFPVGAVRRIDPHLDFLYTSGYDV
ncbi:hypothetical protein AB0D94_19915 [Streptomyces sp. NPDC048255]|uniref:hypothetical protein n=1 Tax=Streptomyces sp. NPDC048255 TaxID=3154713 RepID=UPI0033C16E4C